MNHQNRSHKQIKQHSLNLKKYTFEILIKNDFKTSPLA